MVLTLLSADYAYDSDVVPYIKLFSDGTFEFNTSASYEDIRGGSWVASGSGDIHEHGFILKDFTFSAVFKLSLSTEYNAGYYDFEGFGNAPYGDVYEDSNFFEE